MRTVGHISPACANSGYYIGRAAPLGINMITGAAMPGLRNGFVRVAPAYRWNLFAFAEHSLPQRKRIVVGIAPGAVPDLIGVKSDIIAYFPASQWIARMVQHNQCAAVMGGLNDLFCFFRRFGLKIICRALQANKDVYKRQDEYPGPQRAYALWL